MHCNSERRLRAGLVTCRDQRTVNAPPNRPPASMRFISPLSRLRSFASSWPILLFVFATAVISSAHAQSVHWETGDSGDPSDLQLIFEGCAPDGDPQLPEMDG